MSAVQTHHKVAKLFEALGRRLAMERVVWFETEELLTIQTKLVENAYLQVEDILHPEALGAISI